MRHGSRRAKARRLQVAVAEVLGAAFGLTILAEKPTKPGWRDVDLKPPFLGAGNRVLYVPEGEPADLKVRRMGQPGADVALLSRKAMQAVALYGVPLVIECKNTEGLPVFRLDKAFWLEGKEPRFFRQAYQQAVRQGAHVEPVVVVSKNRWPMVAVVDLHSFDEVRYLPSAVIWRGDPPLVALAFVDLIVRLDGAKKAVS